MSPVWRRIVLWGTLAAVVSWTAFLAHTPHDGTQTDAAMHSRPPHDSTAPPLQPPARPAAKPSPDDLASRLDTRMEKNLFPGAALDQAGAPLRPTPPPQAPPLPFTYAGRWQADDQTTYYLANGDQVIRAQVGQVVVHDWLLEAASGQALDFLYVPLKQTRSLRMGEPLGPNSSPVRPVAGH